jgi:hypothetical protein
MTIAVADDKKILPLRIDFIQEPISISDGSVIREIFKEVSGYGIVSSHNFNPYKDVSYIKSMETKEVKGTVFCIFNSHKTMNEVLQRVSTYVEFTNNVYFTKEEFFSKRPLQKGGINRDLIEYVRGNTPKYAGIRGFDLPGKNINAFLDLSDKDDTIPQGDDKMFAFYEMEKQFLPFLKTLREKFGDDYTLITSFTIDAGISILSHEFLHAQYFSLPEFAKNVDSYVNGLEGSKELELFVAYAKGTAYPKIEEDKSLRNNEYLAFMLAEGMYEDTLARNRPVLTAVMRKELLSDYETDGVSKPFFEEIYNLWKSNDFARGSVTFDELCEKSSEIMKRYDVSKSTVAEQSAFYKYLTDKGARPIIIK